MLTFKSKADLDRLGPVDPARPIIQEFIDRLMKDSSVNNHHYDPENDGYIALIERDDVDRVIHEIWPDRMLVDVPWGGVHKQDGFYVAVYLASNQFGLTFVIAENIVGGELRNVLEDNLIPSTENSSHQP